MIRKKWNEGWSFWKDGHDEERKTVTLPHDAMFKEQRDPQLELGSASAYFPGGKYHYEKSFFADLSLCSGTAILEFEGVYCNSDVYLNGEKVGGWVYGYTNFFVDLTGKLREDAENILHVTVDNMQVPNSRWYSGSGIYRPVYLWTSGVQHILPQGMFVKTCSINPVVLEASVECTPEIDTSAYVALTVFDGDKQIASVRTNPKGSVQIPLKNVTTWSAETPKLYTIRAELRQGKAILDVDSLRFGIRTISWNAKSGLMINGETVKLRGGCIHHDNGILGACTYEEAERRKIKKLKEFGFNAVRFSHYPAGKDLLNVCDELGMYVLDETFDQWRVTKTKYDYAVHFDSECEKDTSALAYKDRNHPSVIMYSIGNEIPDTGRAYGREIANRLSNILRKIDGTRPVTVANNAPMSVVSAAMEELEHERGVAMGSIEINELLTARPDLVQELKNGGYGAERLEKFMGAVFDELEIAGQNYAHEFYEKMHELRPDRILLSTETLPSKMASNWRWVTENPYIIGDFHWTAWDYLGETGVGLPVYGTEEAPFAKPYPCLTAACGSFDLIGEPETAAYYAAILWGAYQKPYIAVRPIVHAGEKYTLGTWRLTDSIASWTWNGCEGKEAQITVYSNGHEVELRQDGKLIARKALIECKAEFETTYLPGSLEAISFDADGNKIAAETLRTAKQSVLLRIVPEQPMISPEQNLAFVPIYLMDEDGVVQMTQDREITVCVDGGGELLALGSARPETEQRFDVPYHLSYHGAVLAVIRRTAMTGSITITASLADGTSAKEELIIRRNE